MATQSISKFKEFLSFNYFFNKKNLNDPKSILTAQAQSFLDTNNYDAYITMIKQGFIPSENQEEQVDAFMKKILSTNGHDPKEFKNYVLLENMLKSGINLKEDHVIHLINTSTQNILCYNKDFFNTQTTTINLIDRTRGYNSIALDSLADQIHSIVSKEDFPDLLLKNFIFRITKEDKKKQHQQEHRFIISQYMPILLQAPELLFKNVSFEQYSILNKKLQKYTLFDTHKETLNSINNNFYKEDMQKIFDNTKTSYAGNLVETLTLSTIKNEKHKLSDLPKEAHAMISEIETLYNKIKIDSSDTSQLELLLEKRIPEVLSKYLTIDPTYRTSLVSSQGKNAQELMLESLNNIKSVFQESFENINQTQVDSLSVTNRYTKSLKM